MNTIEITSVDQYNSIEELVGLLDSVCSFKDLVQDMSWKAYNKWDDNWGTCCDCDRLWMYCCCEEEDDDGEEDIDDGDNI